MSIFKGNKVEKNLGGITKVQKPILTFSKEIPADGYKIIINNDIHIYYSTYNGKNFALEKLQSLQIENDSLNNMEIVDFPKYKYRGLMLDSGRYFYPKSDVIKIIDYMYDLRLNVLHLHLTEDQGWRIQIDKYPLLTKVGSVRNSTNFSLKKHSGFYTKSDLLDIVNYAHERGIIVIPELDIPGHMRAAIAAYPELACLPRKLPVAHWWGTKHDILCAGKDFVYTFLKDVINEILEIFPDGYLHLGGDEAIKTRWKDCPNCQKLIKDNNLKDEDDLQTYFINKIVREILKPRNVTPIIWAVGDMPENYDESIIFQWYGENEISTKTKEVMKKHKIISSNSKYLYFDFPHSKNTLDECFNGDYSINLPNEPVGIEACLWTEYIKDMSILEKRAFPRLIAASLKMWGNEINHDEMISIVNEFYSTHDSTNFTKISKSNPKYFRKIKSIPWDYLRALHWEGLNIVIDNAIVHNKFKKLKK